MVGLFLSPVVLLDRKLNSFKDMFIVYDITLFPYCFLRAQAEGISCTVSCFTMKCECDARI